MHSYFYYAFTFIKSPFIKRYMLDVDLADLLLFTDVHFIHA